MEMVYLGVYSGTFGGGARLRSRAQRCSAYWHTRAAPLMKAKTVLNWAVRVWERVEAASSAASVRLTLAGTTRAACQPGAALARRGLTPRRLNLNIISYFFFRSAYSPRRVRVSTGSHEQEGGVEPLSLPAAYVLNMRSEEKYSVLYSIAAYFLNILEYGYGIFTLTLG